MELMTQTSDLVLTAEVEALRLAPMAEVLFAKAEKDRNRCESMSRI